MAPSAASDVPTVRARSSGVDECAVSTASHHQVVAGVTPFGSFDERGLQLLGGQARVGEDPAQTAGGHQRQVGHGRGRHDEQRHR